MTDGATTTEAGISRRKVATAALWSVPVVSLAMPAPAFAASGCATMTWTSGSVTGRNSAYTTATFTGSVSVRGETKPVTVTSSMTSGAAASDPGDNLAYRSSRGGANRNFVAWAAGRQEGVGTDGKSSASNGQFVVPTGTTQSVLVLNQGSTNTTAAQTLTFSFGGGQVPKSVEMNIYDVTAVSGNGRNDYTDRVRISGGRVEAGPAVGGTTTVSGDTFTGTRQSTTAGSYVPVKVTNISSSNSLKLEYTNPGPLSNAGSNGSIIYNVQYIAIGDVRICY